MHSGVFTFIRMHFAVGVDIKIIISVNCYLWFWLDSDASIKGMCFVPEQECALYCESIARINSPHLY